MYCMEVKDHLSSFQLHPTLKDNEVQVARWRLADVMDI